MRRNWCGPERSNAERLHGRRVPSEGHGPCRPGDAVPKTGERLFAKDWDVVPKPANVRSQKESATLPDMRDGIVTAVSFSDTSRPAWVLVVVLAALLLMGCPPGRISGAVRLSTVGLLRSALGTTSRHHPMSPDGPQTRRSSRRGRGSVSKANRTRCRHAVALRRRTGRAQNST
jgi:hypothetical protein